MENHTIKDYKRNLAQLGASVSDLVAQCYALASENESGDLLSNRIKEVKVSAQAIIRHAEKHLKLRNQATTEELEPKSTHTAQT